MSDLIKRLPVWVGVLVPVVMLIGAMFVLFYRVDRLEADRESDRRQWSRIGANSTALSEMKEWRRRIDAVVTPSGMQEWGWAKSQIRENKEDIERLQDQVRGLAR